ncbi:MAG: hypothetical protein U9O94_11710 [Nanoarchaeota archaeon]|nr:hypothetical protein [Nanoarchaeota archaeon]
MKKGSGTKTRISITLDRGLFKKIDKKCEERLMKVSNYVEKLIEVGLENEKRLRN